jgi:hypothetical protein
MKMAAALENTDGAAATKTCTCCKIEKHTSQFYVNGPRLHGHCKDCHKNKVRVKYATCEHIRKAQKERKQTSEYKQKYRQYKQNRRHIRNVELKQRRESDPFFYLEGLVRCRIRHAFKMKACTKAKRTVAILGCSIQELHSYVGLKPGNDFELDHICPLAQAQNEEELIKLCYYTNLRWIPRHENRTKLHFRTPDGEAKCMELLNRPWI